MGLSIRRDLALLGFPGGSDDKELFTDRRPRLMSGSGRIRGKRTLRLHSVFLLLQRISHGPLWEPGRAGSPTGPEESDAWAFNSSFRT